MNDPQDFPRLGCRECLNGAGLGFDFTMAFQPIINATSREIYAQEALARGLNGEPAGELFRQVNVTNRYRFDQACRVKAVQLASELGIESKLSINFMPNAVYRPELCIRTTLAAAETYGFPIERIIFEITESEAVTDRDHLLGIVRHYQQRGFLTALDDFGAGYAGLSLLAEIQTDLIKLDMDLIRGIDSSHARQAILRGTLLTCRELGIVVIAEGVETREEFELLRREGIELFQGFLFARAGFRSLPAIDWP